MVKKVSKESQEIVQEKLIELKKILPEVFSEGKIDLEKLKLTSNPNTDTRVEKVVYDFDMKSVEGLNRLYKRGFNENVLSKLLSIGVLGLKKDRRLVPTRWSITASDDTVGKRIREDIKYNEIVNGNYCY